MLKEQLSSDLKAAMLSRDTQKVEVIKGLKSAVLYEEVALKIRDTGLSDEQVQQVFAREAKKRAESADLYEKAGQTERAKAEREEKDIIDAYLPQQLGDDELTTIVKEVMTGMDNPQMGQVIGAVKAKVGQAADGGRIAAIVKANLAG